MLEKYYNANPTNYVIGLDYVKTLLLEREYAKAEQVLAAIKILPFEGATAGHRYYRQTKLMLAQQAFSKRNYKVAHKKVEEARLWPLRLGVGEPYSTSKDERIEDYLEACIYKASGDNQKRMKLLTNLADSKADSVSINTVLQIAALKELNRDSEATLLAQKWKNYHKDSQTVEKVEPLLNAVLIEGKDVDMGFFMNLISDKGDERMF
nr:hypothetical protein [Olivibacter sitiensis]